MAAGDPWLGIPIARPVRVLIVELEGPRAHFRKKLGRKAHAWQGSPVDGRIEVVEAPWAVLTLGDGDHRAALADAIRQRAVDVLILGPVTRAGMDAAGTLQETRDFMALVGDVRRLATRTLTVLLVHHENKAGTVSGAFEGAVDTLLHVQAQGHGRTRLFVTKARWSSSHHGTSLALRWADGDGFEVEAAPERTDQTIADELLAFVLKNPGTAWRHVEEAVSGRADRLRAIRDGLIESGALINVSITSRTSLFHCDDPTRPGRDDFGTTDDLGTVGGGRESSRPSSPLKGDERDGTTPIAHRSLDLFGTEAST